jgi:hypothetical protein
VAKSKADAKKEALEKIRAEAAAKKATDEAAKEAAKAAAKAAAQEKADKEAAELRAKIAKASRDMIKMAGLLGQVKPSSPRPNLSDIGDGNNTSATGSTIDTFIAQLELAIGRYIGEVDACNTTYVATRIESKFTASANSARSKCERILKDFERSANYATAQSQAKAYLTNNIELLSCQLASLKLGPKKLEIKAREEEEARKKAEADTKAEAERKAAREAADKAGQEASEARAKEMGEFGKSAAELAARNATVMARARTVEHEEKLKREAATLASRRAATAATRDDELLAVQHATKLTVAQTEGAKAAVKLTAAQSAAYKADQEALADGGRARTWGEAANDAAAAGCAGALGALTAAVVMCGGGAAAPIPPVAAPKPPVAAPKPKPPALGKPPLLTRRGGTRRKHILKRRTTRKNRF